jgi:hypothetical protein
MVGADQVAAGNSGITAFDPVTSLLVSYTSQHQKRSQEVDYILMVASSGLKILLERMARFPRPVEFA